MKKINMALVFLVAISCVNTGRVSKSNDFKLSKETSISVQSSSDAAFGSNLESELLFLGFAVVPYETAISARTTESSIDVSSNSNRTSGSVNSTSYSVKYIPSRIVINVNLTLDRYPAATYLHNANIRIIDLADQKLLASFQYKGNSFTLYNREDLLKKFIADFQTVVN